MIYVLDGQLPWPLVAVALLTGVVGALCFAGWELCKVIKRYLHGADHK